MLRPAGGRPSRKFCSRGGNHELAARLDLRSRAHRDTRFGAAAPRRSQSLKSILTVIGLLAVTGCSPGGEQDEAAVRRVVTEFGRQLQQVSLTADPEIARQAIREHYGAFVSPRLLQKWTQNPALAPGRVTSSP